MGGGGGGSNYKSMNSFSKVFPQSRQEHSSEGPFIIYRRGEGWGLAGGIEIFVNA